MATTANTSMVGCQGMNKHDQVIIFCYYWDTWPVWAATSCGISKVKVSDGERIRPNEAFVTLRCFHIRIRVQLLVQEESTNHKLDRRQLELTCQEWATASRGKSEALDMGGTHPWTTATGQRGRACHMSHALCGPAWQVAPR